MRVAFISTVYNMDLAYQGEILYGLSHLIKKYPWYGDWFKNEQESYLKILDNSIHEECDIDDDEFASYAIDYNFNEIIIPDVMDNYSATIERGNKFLEKHYNLLRKYNIEIMGVLQGSTIEEIIELYKIYKQDERIQVIGLSFTLNVKTFSQLKYVNQYMNRLYILCNLQQECLCSKQVHLLGMNNAYEAGFGLVFPFVRSIDSKLAVRAGYNKVYLKNSSIVSKPVKKLTCEEQLTSDQKDIALDNIYFIKNLVQLQ